MSINNVNLSGNLTHDAEIRQTSGGTSVLDMGLAVNERRKDASGNWGDYANFVDCTMFGTRAEKLAEYLVKGTKVCISGRLHYSSWEKDGQKRSKLSVIVDEIDFMSRGQQQGGYRQGDYRQQPQQRHDAPQGGSGAVYDADIPF